MSIHEHIDHQVRQGLLKRLDPLLVSMATRRTLFVTQNLAAQLSRQSLQDGPRFARLAADLDRFISGDWIEVANRRNGGGLMKRLEPATDEIWTLRSEAPKPGIRVFGRFAMTDIFIATHLALRKELDHYGSQAFSIEIRRCKSEWRKCFASWPPHTSHSISGYISQNVLECGDL
jgi:hypothetical protein